MKEKIKLYYSLTKPGVLYGNAITAVAGFLFASQGQIDWWLFLAVNGGTTLIIASACVINNYLDQDIDKKMERTKKRVIVSGEVPSRNAIMLSIVLGVIGFAILVAYTNWLVVIVGVIGYIDYVVLYGMLSKRLSIHGTLVGSISGAAPILAGYLGVTGQIDANAIILFAVLFLWQMPEFYSIAIYRCKEYAAAKIPVISVIKGIRITTIQIFFYTLAFVMSTILLTSTGTASLSYLAVMTVLGVYWLYLAIVGLQTPDNGKDAWARKMFHYSLIILLAFCGTISIDNLLP
jgi:protoheme IX farnesyltransferase